MSACSSNRRKTAMPTSDVRTVATKSRKSYRFTYSIRTNFSKVGQKPHRPQNAKSLTSVVSTAHVGANPTLTYAAGSTGGNHGGPPSSRQGPTNARTNWRLSRRRRDVPGEACSTTRR
jgi:hypothetical protein